MNELFLALQVALDVCVVLSLMRHREIFINHATYIADHHRIIGRINAALQSQGDINQSVLDALKNLEYPEDSQ